MNNQNIIVFHSRFGNMVYLSHSQYRKLLVAYASGFKKKNRFVNMLIDKSIIVPLGYDEDLFFEKLLEKTIADTKSGKLWKFLRLSLTESCNLNCKYCYINDRGSLIKSMMSASVAERSIDLFYNNIANKEIRKTSIWFYGGEPLLNEDVLLQSLKMIVSRNLTLKEQGCDVPDIGINTNGVIYPNRLIEYIIKTNTTMLLSIDGLYDYHDNARPFPSGKGSFKIIDKNIKKYLKNNVKLKLGAVLTTLNWEGVEELIDYSANLGLKTINIDAVTFCDQYNLENDKKVKKILSLIDYSKSKGVYITGFWRDCVDNLAMVRSWRYCAGQGNEINVVPDGRVKICAGFKDTVGHINDLSKVFNDNRYLDMAKRLVGNLGKCNGCFLEGSCRGGCVAEVLNASKKIYEPSVCNFFKTFTFDYLEKIFQDDLLFVNGTGEN